MRPWRGAVAAEGIHVGRVEEVDAPFAGPVEDGDRGFLVALKTERHGPEAEPRHLESGSVPNRLWSTPES